MSINYKVCSKLELYLPRQKLTMYETLIFLKIVSLQFNTTIQVSFPLVKAALKRAQCLKKNATCQVIGSMKKRNDPETLDVHTILYIHQTVQYIWHIISQI